MTCHLLFVIDVDLPCLLSTVRYDFIRSDRGELCYTHAMTSDQQIWQSWARMIDKWGCINLVTAFLEAAGPLTTLGAQFIYLGQPYLRFIIHSEQLLALTDILEDPGQTHRFIQYLREESPT